MEGMLERSGMGRARKGKRGRMVCSIDVLQRGAVVDGQGWCGSTIVR